MAVLTGIDVFSASHDFRTSRYKIPIFLDCSNQCDHGANGEVPDQLASSHSRSQGSAHWLADIQYGDFPETPKLERHSRSTKSAESWVHAGKEIKLNLMVPVDCDAR
jgi:hypothetical protein